MYQERTEMPDQQPQVMILGVYHMGNNNRDLIQTHYDEHRSAKRLVEIDDVPRQQHRTGITCKFVSCILR